MEKIAFKIISVCIITSLLIPVATGLKHDSDDTNTLTLDSYIVITLYEIDDDGYLIFNVTNGCIIDINDITMDVHFKGTGPFFGFNKVDVSTEIFIQNLPKGKSELVKTKDQAFKVIPIFRRPIIPFFIGEIDLECNGYAEKASVTKVGVRIRTEFIFIPCE